MKLKVQYKEEVPCEIRQQENSGRCNILKYSLLDQLTFATAKFRSEEHTSELQSQSNLVCRLLLEKKKICSSPSLLDMARYSPAGSCVFDFSTMNPLRYRSAINATTICIPTASARPSVNPITALCT